MCILQILFAAVHFIRIKSARLLAGELCFLAAFASANANIERCIISIYSVTKGSAEERLRGGESSGEWRLLIECTKGRDGTRT